MPRDSAGVMTLPPTTWATTGQTISVNQHNPAMREIEAALTESLPRNGSAGLTGHFNANGFRITNLADPVSDGDAVSLGFARNATPIGMVMDYAGDFAPDGWMLCDGRSLSRTNEAALFAVIGTKFGSSSGTTFNIPDLRGRVVVGKDDMGGTDAARMSFFGSLARTIGSVFGSASHVLTLGQMAKHEHNLTINGSGQHSHGNVPARGYGSSAGTGDLFSLGSVGRTDESGQHTHSGTANSTGNDEAHTNTQPSIVMNKIIRVR